MGRLAMRLRWGSAISAIGAILLGLAVAGAPAVLQGQSQTENAKGDRVSPGTVFRTSDRCVACHNGMTTKDGEDISIGVQWRSSIMANSSRDPYWQGSVRRGAIDYPGGEEGIEG